MDNYKQRLLLALKEEQGIKKKARNYLWIGLAAIVIGFVSSLLVKVLNSEVAIVISCGLFFRGLSLLAFSEGARNEYYAIGKEFKSGHDLWKSESFDNAFHPKEYIFKSQSNPKKKAFII